MKLRSPSNTLIPRLAVCSWSLRPKDPNDLLVQLQATGLNRLQIALDPICEAPQVWASLPALFWQKGVVLVSGMFGCIGEDYTTLESIRRTGGLVPDATWEQNWRNVQVLASVGQRLGLRLVSFHAGFVPQDQDDPNYAKLVERVAMVADIFAARRIELAFETGQESAAHLRTFLQKVRRANVGVNFDPANMILYDKGDPIEAVRLLGPWIRQVHLKDAKRTQVPGTWGEEVPVGTGEVNWKEFLQALERGHFQGNFCIEREAGEERAADIRAARHFVEKLAL